MNLRSIVLGVLLCVPGSADLALADDPQTDTIRVAITGVPQGTLPTIHFHAPGKLLVQHVAESLVGYRDDLSIAPVLADSWDIRDNGKTYRFTLREDTVFHNGETVTAEHVASNWRNLYLNDDFEWDCRPYYDGSGTIEERTTGVDVESVTAVDERTVEFRLRKANSLFLDRLADVSCMPVVFHPDSFNDDGTWHTLIGSGPYHLTDTRMGQQIDLVRFEDYRPRSEPRDGYGGAREAHIHTIRLQVYASTVEAVAALQNGNVDYVQAISPAERLEVLEDPELAIATSTNITYWTLLLQTQDPVLSDPALRRGIAQSIDTDRIALAVSGHRMAGHDSVVSAQSMYSSPAQTKRHEYDLDAARVLIQESGYNGESISIQCSRDTYPTSCVIANMARNMMREAGVNAEVWPMSWNSLKDEYYMSGRYQMQAFLIGGRTSPTLGYGKFIGSRKDNPRFYWNNENAYSQLEAAELAETPDELQSIYDKLHLMMLDDVPQIIVMNREQDDAYRVGFIGIQPTHFGRIPFWGVRKDAD